MDETVDGDGGLWAQGTPHSAFPQHPREPSPSSAANRHAALAGINTHLSDHVFSSPLCTSSVTTGGGLDDYTVERGRGSRLCVRREVRARWCGPGVKARSGEMDYTLGYEVELGWSEWERDLVRWREDCGEDAWWGFGGFGGGGGGVARSLGNSGQCACTGVPTVFDERHMSRVFEFNHDHAFHTTVDETMNKKQYTISLIYLCKAESG
ncbi:hypothetical protein DFJ77DRAFT_540390 [Powellomyces hirtus]|nr:hypothetical protein DFJ77DRAFT_540390 [Powellomyces hirtus]